jgi:hypothetical protein
MIGGHGEGAGTSRQKVDVGEDVAWAGALEDLFQEAGSLIAQRNGYDRDGERGPHLTAVSSEEEGDEKEHQDQADALVAQDRHHKVEGGILERPVDEKESPSIDRLKDFAQVHRLL